MKKVRTLFRFDNRFKRKTDGFIAGVDEVGRGPLAGPVVAAAVIFRRKVLLPGLNDSKKTPVRLREKLFGQIIRHALVGIGRVDESIIDQINIFQATRLAMREAVLALSHTPHLVLIDGKINLDLPIPQIGIVKGDCQSAAIAAASNVAKVYRDHWMKELDPHYPEYGFAKHKGYPTPKHVKALRIQGATPIHRKSFRPVAQVLNEARS